jgi:hypothetical protein
MLGADYHDKISDDFWHIECHRKINKLPYGMNIEIEVYEQADRRVRPRTQNNRYKHRMSPALKVSLQNEIRDRILKNRNNGS